MKKNTRAVLLHITPSDQLPWWWDDIRRDQQLCEIDYIPLKFRGKKSKQITTLELPFFFARLLRELLALRRKYDYVFTVECDFTGFGLALLQSLLFMRRPRHVILQFIMRERTPRLASRVKYALMTFMFQSLHRVICSSRAETNYYTRVFGWDADKAQFVPILTNPRYLESADVGADEKYVMAAGRVFRDYQTVIQAVRGTPFKLIIVGGAGVTREIDGDEQIEVLEEVSHDRFIALTRRASAVVVPLVHSRISAGQTVVLQAMAMGKLVIATRTAGTEDYIDHMVDGMLVAPGDIEQMRRAIGAAANSELRERLGRAARERIATGHLPHHYSAAIRRAVMPPSVRSRQVLQSGA